MPTRATINGVPYILFWKNIGVDPQKGVKFHIGCKDADLSPAPLYVVGEKMKETERTMWRGAEHEVLKVTGNERVTCRGCGLEFVTAKDEPGKCPICGQARALEVVEDET